MPRVISIDNTTEALRSCWHPVARSAVVGPNPTRVELLGHAYVVSRLDGKTVVAFEDRCPHRFGRLSDGTVHGGALTCPYHGWQFDHDGSCLLIPSLGPGAAMPKRASLEPLAVCERYGLVWLAPAAPTIPLIEIDEWADQSLTPVWLPEVDVRAGAAQFIDNFLDFAHFPFVHLGTFGDAESPFLEDYTVEKHPHGLVVQYEHTIANNEDPLVGTGVHPLVQPRIMRYQYTVPFSALLRLELPMPQSVNAIAIFCQPMHVGLTRLYMVMLRNDCPDEASAQNAIDYEMAVLREDLRIIEKLPDPSLPLDATGQVHTRADRSTVEFRRLLRELVQPSSQ